MRAMIHRICLHGTDKHKLMNSGKNIFIAMPPGNKNVLFFFSFQRRSKKCLSTLKCGSLMSNWVHTSHSQRISVSLTWKWRVHAGNRPSVSYHPSQDSYTKTQKGQTRRMERIKNKESLFGKFLVNFTAILKFKRAESFRKWILTKGAPSFIFIFFTFNLSYITRWQR